MKVNDLFTWYKTSRNWELLSHNSQIFYSLMIKTMSSEIGNYNIESITHTKVDEVYNSIKTSVSLHRAVYSCKVMSKIWNRAIRQGYTSFNPFSSMGLPKLQSRPNKWSIEQINKFYVETVSRRIPSLGLLALMCFDLCQRPGDMRMLKFSNISDGWVNFIQEKTKTRMHIKLSDRIIDMLSELEPESEDDFIIKYELTNKPYDARTYAKLVQEIRTDLGLPDDLQMRDLRRTGLSELGDNGATEDEIRSISGHVDRQVISTYIPVTQTLVEHGMNKRPKRLIPDALAHYDELVSNT